jgi:hypothetical protein
MRDEGNDARGDDARRRRARENETRRDETRLERTIDRLTRDDDATRRRDSMTRMIGFSGYAQARTHDQRTDDGGARGVLGTVHAIRVAGATEKLYITRVSHRERERAGV